jgi:hypothetical protein
VKHKNGHEFLRAALTGKAMSPVILGKSDLAYDHGGMAGVIDEGQAIYQLIGIYETREVPGDPYVIKVGDVLKTRDGRSARIVATDRKCNDGFTVVALVRVTETSEIVFNFKANGRYSYYDDSPRDPSDLILPEPQLQRITKLWKE